MRQKRVRVKIATFLVLSILTTGTLSAGCRVIPTGGSTPTPTLVSPGGVVTGQASVDRVEIVMRESFPVQISALAVGGLPDGCTVLDQVIQEREENTFHITLTTTRPSDEDCTAVLVPFQKAVEIESVGLKAGKYTVLVNGVTAEFELEVDNILDNTLLEEPAPDASPKPADLGYPPPALPAGTGVYPTP
jgi:inhibitor of cysteine peptidase